MCPSWGLVDQILRAGGKSIPYFVPLSLVRVSIHGAIALRKGRKTLSNRGCPHRSGATEQQRFRPRSNTAGNTLRSCRSGHVPRARAKGLSRGTFRVNYVVSEQFDVQVIDDSRTFGRTLRNASSIDEILRRYQHAINVNSVVWRKVQIPVRGPLVERKAADPNRLKVLRPAFSALLEPLTANHLIGLLSPDNVTIRSPTLSSSIIRSPSEYECEYRVEANYTAVILLPPDNN